MRCDAMPNSNPNKKILSPRLPQEAALLGDQTTTVREFLPFWLSTAAAAADIMSVYRIEIKNVFSFFSFQAKKRQGKGKARVGVAACAVRLMCACTGAG